MEMPEMVSATLGIAPPWYVSTVNIAEGGKRLDITVSYDADSIKVCPRCGARGATCDLATETWYHHDFFCYNTYLHMRVPRLTCCGVIHTVHERPWARAGSKFVKITPDARTERCMRCDE